MALEIYLLNDNKNCCVYDLDLLLNFYVVVII